MFGLGLSLNEEKTQALLISKKRDKGHNIRTAVKKEFRISGNSISIEIRLKYLGVMINENLQ